MKYPIGIQSFEEIRTSGYAYVDKTTLIHKLVAEGKYYFLSRPRRFGKILLLSTMRAYFEGKRQLFQGLAMEHLEQDWTEYPILYPDLNARDYSSLDALVAELNKYLEQWEMLYCGQRSDRAIEERFGAVIKAAALKTGKKVVILVDEYDKPMQPTNANFSKSASTSPPKLHVSRTGK